MRSEVLRQIMKAVLSGEENPRKGQVVAVLSAAKLKEFKQFSDDVREYESQCDCGAPDGMCCGKTRKVFMSRHNELWDSIRKEHDLSPRLVLSVNTETGEVIEQ